MLYWARDTACKLSSNRGRQETLMNHALVTDTMDIWPRMDGRESVKHRRPFCVVRESVFLCRE
eukprot:974065-Prorocentrum_lima.AAC.1